MRVQPDMAHGRKVQDDFIIAVPAHGHVFRDLAKVCAPGSGAPEEMGHPARCAAPAPWADVNWARKRLRAKL